jgi:hypothetical protein
MMMMMMMMMSQDSAVCTVINLWTADRGANAFNSLNYVKENLVFPYNRNIIKNGAIKIFHFMATLSYLFFGLQVDWPMDNLKSS